MKVLGIESSNNTASVAIVQDNRLISEFTVNNTMRHSTTIMPMIDRILGGESLDTIDLVAVSNGPGSFTGLRIGGAIAKAIAQAQNIPIVAVPTLQSLANHYDIDQAWIGVLVHARAEEVYFESYRMEHKGQIHFPHVLEPLRTYQISELVDKLEKMEKNEYSVCYLAGDGVERFEPQFGGLVDKFHLSRLINCSFSAKNIALLGISLYDRGEYTDYKRHKPFYYKKTQAEREYEAGSND